ncbi:MAG: WhiB family transcriptional regulator [Acidimicrobiales bacterium]
MEQKIETELIISALALCGACPVVEPCRAAGAREPDGVWGGTTPRDRRRARRRL